MKWTSSHLWTRATELRRPLTTRKLKVRTNDTGDRGINNTTEWFWIVLTTVRLFFYTLIFPSSSSFMCFVHIWTQSWTRCLRTQWPKRQQAQHEPDHVPIQTATSRYTTTTIKVPLRTRKKSRNCAAWVLLQIKPRERCLRTTMTWAKHATTCWGCRESVEYIHVLRFTTGRTYV